MEAAMARRSILLLVGLGVTAGLALVPVRAEDKKGQVIRTEGKEAVLARTIDFPGVVGVDVPALLTLGGRIDQAREQPDPVCLALAALELEAAEQAGGKTAAVKSTDLVRTASFPSVLMTWPFLWSLPPSSSMPDFSGMRDLLGCTRSGRG
jgi:hypothetical protein